MAEAPPDVLGELRAELTGVLLDDPAGLADYALDASHAEGVVPIAVVEAADRADVEATMRWAFRHRIPVTPRGGGTGKAGGCVPEPGGIVLLMTEMNRILSIRPEHGWAEVEPGVVTGPFRELVEREHRLFYPPDPASLETCTLGGNVATNAGGPVALKYGVTREHVLGVEAVLPDGTVLETGRRQPKGVAGYDLTSLLVGSEGTLGVITKIRLRLRPRPRHVVAAMVPYASAQAAAAAVLESAREGLQPRALELFDRTTIQRAARAPGSSFRPTWGALLLVEFDGEPGQTTRALKRFVEDVSASPEEVLVADTDASRARLWKVRYSTSSAVKLGAVGWATEDVAVPLGNMPAMLEALTGIGERHDLIAFAYGHAGDGNLHVNLLWEDEAGGERAPAAIDEVMAMALGLGGTITGEHGVGLLKRRYLAEELGDPQLALQRSMKRLWDPRGILNPSKVLP